MASDVETTIRNAAYRFAKALEDASALEVETSFIEVGDEETIDFTHARPVAKTTIELDGDMKMVTECRNNFLAFILTKQTIIDKYTYKLIANGFVYQRGRHRRIHPAA